LKTFLWAQWENELIVKIGNSCVKLLQKI
jgi:hypothetical protein